MRHPWSGHEVVQLLGNTALGGAVPIVHELCRVCESLDLSPIVLASDPAVKEFLQTRGWDVWEFAGIVREPQPARDLATAFRLARNLSRRGTRIVHTHTSKGGMVGRLGGRLAGCDLVIHHTHGFYHTGLNPGPVRAGMFTLEWIFGRMDDYQLFVNSADEQDALARGIARPGRTATLFNGVADPYAPGRAMAASWRSEWGIPDDVPVVGVVSRLAPRKGVQDAIGAFARIVESVPECRLVVIGDGVLGDEARAIVADLGLRDRVVFTGHIADAGRCFSAFDVAIAPSLHEGQSVSVIEALACGTPVVATDIRGHRDMVLDQRTGLLCPVGDVRAIADAVTTLLKDDGSRARMSAGARERYLANFTLEHFRVTAKAFYRQALVSRYGEGEEAE